MRGKTDGLGTGEEQDRNSFKCHLLTSKCSLKYNSPKSLRGQMNFCRNSWRGVLSWWCKALPTRHPDLTPSSNRLETTAGTTTFGCQKKKSLKLKHFPVSHSPNFKKGQYINYATTEMNSLHQKMKADDSGYGRKMSYFLAADPKEVAWDRQQQVLEEYWTPLLLPCFWQNICS